MARTVIRNFFAQVDGVTNNCLKGVQRPSSAVVCLAEYALLFLKSERVFFQFKANNVVMDKSLPAVIRVFQLSERLSISIFL
jgi:hypothetical protein